MTFSAVVTAHDAWPIDILTNLLRQTRQPDEILIYLSGKIQAQNFSIRSPLPPLSVFFVPNKNDWGHEKRAQGLAAASGDFIGWFNHDDEYELDFIETMLAAVENADVAFCKWSHGGKGFGVNNDVVFAGGNSTSGNWIGRTSLIREVGYHSRDYSADAHLIDAVRPHAKVVRVERCLYHHNP